MWVGGWVCIHAGECASAGTLRPARTHMDASTRARIHPYTHTQTRKHARANTQHTHTHARIPIQVEMLKEAVVTQNAELDKKTAESVPETNQPLPQQLQLQMQMQRK